MKPRAAKPTAISLIAMLGLQTAVRAQSAPPAINYQGRLTLSTGAVVPDGLTGMRVRIFATASGGNALWDSGDLSVATKSGTFSILLGSGGMPALSPLVFAFGTVYVEIQPTGQAPLLPRQPIASVPWSFYAQTVSDGSISNEKLMNGSVSSAKLIDGAVTTIKLGDGSVSTIKLGDQQVTLEKLAAQSVSTAKLVNLAVTTAIIADNAVTAAKISDGSVISAKLASGSVTTAKLASSAVGNAALASDAASLSRVSGGVMVATGGNVGVGTGTPLSKFHVNGDLRSNGVISSWHELYDTTPFIDFHLGSLPGQDYNYRIVNPSDGFLQFVNSGGVRVTFSNGGRVGIGTASPSAMLHVTGVIRTDNDGQKPGGGEWSTTSDIRLKKNIRPIESPLQRLLGLKGVTFEYISPRSINELNGPQEGFIAQQVEKAFPGWVRTQSTGIKTLSLPTGFNAITVEAIREQQAQIESLKAENSRLKREISAIWSELKKHR